jgi:CRISPR-associated protein Csy1
MDALRSDGDLDAAWRAADVAWFASGEGQRSPGLKAQLARLALPPVMVSTASIEADRKRFGLALDALHAAWTPSMLASCEPRLEQLAWTNFHLAYHGEDDRDLQQSYAALIERATSTFFPQLAEAPPRRASRRIGLLSSCWRECTAGMYFAGWIDWLRQAGYEVHLYQLGPHRDAFTGQLASRASAFRFHRGPLHDLAAALRGDELDLLIYPELGMDARLLPLAALRLAPRQVVGWGHPVTTGFSTIDAFFTCEAMEPADASRYYSETLLPLPGLGVAYARPPVPPVCDRATLGLPDDAVLALVPQSLFKLHPDDDLVLARFAATVPDAKIVMFEGEHPRWRSQFESRLAPHFAALGLDPARHLHWLASGSRERYLQINMACDLMLDSLRWSGGNTSLDALATGLPVVTCPGTMLRARQSAAMLDRMGLGPDLVVSSPAQLVERASSLAIDAHARRVLSTRILAGQSALHDHDATRQSFLEHVAFLIEAGATK